MPSIPLFDPPDVAALPWYGTDRVLPASRFIPGRSPRPARTGHEAHAPWMPEQWPTLQPYLRGVDLFNRWYFWEAHEAWEPLWRAHHARTDPARFIQGLIGAAAALLKLHMGHAQSARTLSRTACERLARLRGVWMGLAVETFRSDVDRYLVPAATGARPAFGSDTPRMYLERIV